jgi:hypothetical protein
VKHPFATPTPPLPILDRWPEVPFRLADSVGPVWLEHPPYPKDRPLCAIEGLHEGKTCKLNQPRGEQTR